MLLALLSWLALAAPACADEQYDVGPSPILNVHAQPRQADRPDLGPPAGANSSDQPPSTCSIASRPAGRFAHSEADSDVRPSRSRREHGLVSLPAEILRAPRLSPARSTTRSSRAAAGNMTITIPRGTAHGDGPRPRRPSQPERLSRHLRRARPRGGIDAQPRERHRFRRVAARTNIVATNSSFDRLRMRTATGNMLFTGVHVASNSRQPAAYGSIVYDNGHFQPGLARFESEHGNVALGVRGGAQIGAHSGAGHVVSSFHDEAHVQGNPTTKQATVEGGGPVVTATSKNGSVYLYSGSMNEHPHVREQLSGSTRLPTTRMPSAAPPPPHEQPFQRFNRLRQPPRPPFPNRT